MGTAFNWVDYVILGIFAISILAGLLRGLVKEVISVVTWAAALITASLFAERLANAFAHTMPIESSISNTKNIGINAANSVSMLAISVSFIGIFVVTLIIGALINYFISRAIDAGGISIGNRLLGGVFGLIRGFLVNWVLILLIQLSPIAKQSDWEHSQFVKSYQPWIRLVEKWIEPQLLQLKSTVTQQLENSQMRLRQFVSKSFSQNE